MLIGSMPEQKRKMTKPKIRVTFTPEAPRESDHLSRAHNVSLWAQYQALKDEDLNAQDLNLPYSKGAQPCRTTKTGT